MRLPTNMHFIRRRVESPQKVIEPVVTKDQAVADLGCGLGFYTIALAQSGKAVTRFTNMSLMIFCAKTK